MKRLLLILLALVMVAPIAIAETTASTTIDGSDLRAELRRIIGQARDRVFPALVSIQVITVDYRGGREIKGGTTGSGTIISQDGHVLTNQHVTAGGERFTVTLSDKREVEADLVGEDPLTDLAVLQIKRDELDDPDTPLAVASFGDSDQLETGDYVMAMGSPFSLSRSVTLGIVANTERVFAGGFGRDDVEAMELSQGQRTGLFTRWIQHDALIHPGNSGGPLVDLTGEIVGVNELGGNAMGFAIPSNLAKRVSAALIEHGEVERSWIGASFKTIRRTGLEEGVLVNSVVLGGPAERAGIAAGDVVTSLDGEPVTVRFPEQLPLLLDQIASRPVGATIAFGVQRDGTVEIANVVSEKLEKDVGRELALHDWGMNVQAITSKMARDLRLDDADGVLITGVRAGGAAQTAEPPLSAGDVLRAVGAVAVPDLTTLVERYEVLEDSTEPVLVAFDRAGKNQLTLLEPRDDRVDDPPRELPKGWIGAAVQPLAPALTRALALDENLRGFRVTRVYPGTEAAASGLMVGDVVTAVDGEPLEPNGVQDNGLWTRRIRTLSIGAQATLDLLRDGTPTQLSVPVERTRITPDEARRHRDDDFELAVRELTFFDRDVNLWNEDTKGVLVEQVEPGGWTFLGGIRPGDLVLSIADQPVRGLKSFRAAMTKLKEDEPERVVFLVLRGVETHFQYVEPEWTPVVE
ncbi:MAG: PDZ domain-containing protein [Acidobacteriota bacterium]